MNPQPLTRAAYEIEIVARRGQAVRVPFRQVTLGTWQPKRNDCHNNVDMFIAANPGMEAVRGWMVESIGSLTAHSVIRDADGQLFDITPFADESLRLGFVEHRGADATFNEVKAAGVQILHLADGETLREMLAMAAVVGIERYEQDPGQGEAGEYE